MNNRYTQTSNERYRPESPGFVLSKNKKSGKDIIKRTVFLHRFMALH